MNAVTPTADEDLFTAMAALEDVPQNRTADTGKFTYRYADLASVLGYVRPLLAEHRFVVTQPVGGTAGEVSVGTVLIHRSGVRFPSPLLVAKVSDDPQRIGSTITYLRRYSLLAHLGLSTEDDDGASQHSAAQAPVRARTAVQRQTTDKLTAKAMALFGELGYGHREDRLDKTSDILGRDVSSWTSLSGAERMVVLDALEQEASHAP